MNTRTAFSERIIALRSEKRLTQGKLAETLGISRQSITQYENGIRIPDIEVLRKFAEYFGVTADYLLGLSNNRTAETAAIGDKLGLSDEAIERLSMYASYFKESVERSVETAKSIPESQRRKILYSQSPLKVINSLISNWKVSSAIQIYLLGMNNEIIESVNFESLESNSGFHTEKELVEELKEAKEALNMYRVQKALTELREEYKKATPPSEPFDFVLVEEDCDPYAQED